MCGICGVREFRSRPHAQSVIQMMAALSHRGPDGSGYFRDDEVALGHVRLAIVDTANGVQPMCNEDEQVWVTFNGEIFNYVELMAQLRDRGHVFRTHCDTEVIVHAWEEWGPACFDRFNGQWACAIWDRGSRDLILSRDRFGVRPLYHTRVGNRFLFASEVKALFTDQATLREIDPVGLDQSFTFWSTVAPQTIFSQISQVPPGHYLVVDANGHEELRRYWEPSFPERGHEEFQRLDENAERLKESVVEATRLRFLRSDVPVGAYLSGGIDSAVTASVIAAFTDAPLSTFSLRFADREFDEGPYQRLMSQRLGTTHQDIIVSERDIGEVFPEVVWHAENPLLRTAPAPMFLLSRLVRSAGFKVVVTGEGSDEVLAGYDIFREARVRLFWSRDPSSAQRARAVELLYPWMKRSPNLAPAFAQSFFGRNLDPDDPALSHRPRWDSTSVLKSMLTPAVSMQGLSAEGSLVASMPPASQRWDPLSRAQWLEMTTLLPGYILSSQGDRMLMANGIEGRFPFLDPDVARLAANLPARQKILGLDEKHLLKRAFRDLVPEEIRRRPKQPYRAPDAASFYPDPPEWFGDLTSDAAIRDAGIFRPVVVQGMMRKLAQRGARGLSNTDNMRLVSILSVQLLHGLFVRGDHDLPAAPPQPMAVFDRQTTRGAK